jgi:hypothetical protein
MQSEARAAMGLRFLVHCGVLVGASCALAIILSASAEAQQPEKSNMELVGYNDLQNRSAYQPVVHKQGASWLAYIGHHGGTSFNPITGVQEPNGTSIVDVTDPRRPRYLAHIPGEGSGTGESGGAQMVRVCDGSDLPHADKTKVYLLRSFGTSAHEIWDVTDPAKSSRLTVIASGLRDTHKSWWECDTGIAYLVSGVPGWRTKRMAQIYDLSDPKKPVFIRNFGLAGHQPGASGPIPSDLHGPISTGPRGNRVYFAYGTTHSGVLQIVDRDKLLNGPKEPTDENLRYPQVGRVDLPPDAGAHTTFPVLGMELPEFARNEPGRLRDFVVVTGETVRNECPETRQMVRIFDITTESTPVGVSTWTLPEDSGNFCSRGGRFGTHSSSESFTPAYYKRVLFIAHFNAGVRALDIRDPFHTREIGYYIPPTTDKTDKRCVGTGADEHCKVAVQTNNVEVDDRGYIYIVDRANTGLHILELTGSARQVANLP